MKTPTFWQESKGGLWANILMPLGCLYGAISQKRARRSPQYRSSVPVVCVGNLTMGGAGKTPTAQLIATQVKEMGLKPMFLSRGYGGTTHGPVFVDQQDAREVGDEPLLLAQTAPVCVARDRIEGAKACEKAGADLIIMDDGFQNPTLFKDFALLVIDGGFGNGNARVFPAGPLRESLQHGLKRAQAILIIGDDKTAIADQIKRIDPTFPILNGHIQPIEAERFRGIKILAFAGIGRPQKFFDTLKGLGCHLEETQSFADHHAFSEPEMQNLKARAKQLDARLVTTQKDYVRLPDTLREGIDVLKIKLACAQPDMLKASVMKAVLPAEPTPE